MATITIRNLDDDPMAQLRALAARSGHSLEEEVREILRSALRREEPAHAGLGSLIRDHFAQAGGVELELPDRRMTDRWP